MQNAEKSFMMNEQYLGYGIGYDLFWKIYYINVGFYKIELILIILTIYIKFI